VPGASETRIAELKPSVARPVDKARIRFAKSGALRLLSHHDLMRTFERLLRRSELPFHRSQGFHPKPRLVFALSLPLGVVGRNEVVELELSDRVDPEEIHFRLARQTPPGLEIHSVRRIAIGTTAQVRHLGYSLPIPSERIPDVLSRINEILAASECWIERRRPQSRQPQKRLDVRPYLVDLSINQRSGSSDSAELEMVFRLTPTGTARPEEVMGLLGLDYLLDAGVVLERSRLELHDET
jgi:radical SAM-linked protein